MAIRNLQDTIRSFENQPTVGTSDMKKEDILMPSTKGVFYIMFTRYPDPLVVNQDALKQIFRMLVRTVSMPDITYNTVESVNGFAGTSKAYSPGNVEYDTTLEIGFNENVDRMALHELFNWSNGIRDMHTGLSSFQKYTSRNISADILIIHTKPVYIMGNDSMAENMQEAYWFKHITPTNLPLSAYASVDKADSAKVELSVNFKFREVVISLNNPSLKEYALEQLPNLISGAKLSKDVSFS